jgi:hypothetical protein
MTVSVFVGTSVDGFIARPDGELDWLPEGGGEPQGYNEFFASVRASTGLNREKPFHAETRGTRRGQPPLRARKAT